ncbi:hypothetical protein L1987_20044 [Smallanthus sonchifolius]|uniref:Uncharacterized protein n=1 Tax=Smallanthus sonchifolius TaxID=185202 RepID=A0ACB9ITN7_9ASTR|nr:hypothetical protein L1987_20044 [Smallanthus sonchifolius]
MPLCRRSHICKEILDTLIIVYEANKKKSSTTYTTYTNNSGSEDDNPEKSGDIGDLKTMVEDVNVLLVKKFKMLT